MSRPSPRWSLVLTAVVLGSSTGLLVGCGDDRPASSGSDAISGTVTVLAAASLTGTFEAIATAFERAHPGVHVALTFDGSSRLAAQILEGAPADVFASADEATLAGVVDAGATEGPTVDIATNELQIVVAEANPLGIAGLADLGPPVRLALCEAEVPCGAYAAQAFVQAGLPVPAAGEESSVKGVLTKVQLGEADAGLVYVTDVLAATGVAGVDLAPGEGVVAAYPATVLRDAPNPDAAAAFLAFLTGAAAQRILADAGFGLP